MSKTGTKGKPKAKAISSKELSRKFTEEDKALVEELFKHARLSTGGEEKTLTFLIKRKAEILVKIDHFSIKTKK